MPCLFATPRWITISRPWSKYLNTLFDFPKCSCRFDRFLSCFYKACQDKLLPQALREIDSFTSDLLSVMKELLFTWILKVILVQFHPIICPSLVIFSLLFSVTAFLYTNAMLVWNAKMNHYFKSLNKYLNALFDFPKCSCRFTGFCHVFTRFTGDNRLLGLQWIAKGKNWSS